MDGENIDDEDIVDGRLQIGIEIENGENGSTETINNGEFNSRTAPDGKTETRF